MKKKLLLALAIWLVCFLIASIPFVHAGGSVFLARGSGGGGGDVTAPTLQSATIASNGTTWTFVFDEDVNIGSGGSGGWSVTMTTAGSVTLTYSSGDGTSSLVYTGGTTVNSGDTVSAGLDYTQPGDGIEDDAGNDLATIDDASVTNNSTQGSCDTAFLTNSGTPSGDFDVGDNTDYYYVGQSFEVSQSRSVCKATFNLTYKTGSITGKTFTAYIYSLSSGYFDTLLGTSSGVSGSNSWSNTAVEFSFGTPASLTTGTTYAVVVSMDEVDSSNYAEMEFISSGIDTGTTMRWNSSGTPTGSNASDSILILYE